MLWAPALTRPPSRLQQTLLCPPLLLPMGQKREMLAGTSPLISKELGKAQDTGRCGDLLGDVW